MGGHQVAKYKTAIYSYYQKLNTIGRFQLQYLYLLPPNQTSESCFQSSIPETELRTSILTTSFVQNKFKTSLKQVIYQPKGSMDIALLIPSTKEFLKTGVTCKKKKTSYFQLIRQTEICPADIYTVVELKSTEKYIEPPKKKTISIKNIISNNEKPKVYPFCDHYS